MSRLARMVWCTYARCWIPMGRARTRCPDCGAVVQTQSPLDAHYVQEREA